METAEPVDLFLVLTPDFVFFAAGCGFVFFAEHAVIHHFADGFSL
jgi:hypothetical protein